MTVFIALSILCAPAPDLAHEDMRELAVALSDEGRFVEAAVRFEAIAAAGGPSVVHFEAGQMRFAAGHMAHAARHFQAYIASDLDADDLSLAQLRLAKAATGTRLIEVRLSPAIATTIHAHRIGDPPDSQRPDLDTPIGGGLAALRLDPGTWQLRIDAPGYVPLHQNIEVTDVRTPIELRLEPEPVPAPAPTIGPAPRPRDLRRARGQTIAGAVALPLGVAALAGFITATVGYRHSSAREKLVGYHCNDRAALDDLRLTAQRQIGAMVGLGVASGALLSAGVVLLVRGAPALSTPTTPACSCPAASETPMRLTSLLPLLACGGCLLRDIDRHIDELHCSGTTTTTTAGETDTTGCPADSTGGIETTTEATHTTSDTTSTTAGSDSDSAGTSTGTTDTSSTGEPVAVCGNGVVEAFGPSPEDCDDGNDDPDDGCSDCGRDRLVFITSDNYQAAIFIGIVGVDQRCRHLAAVQNLPKFAEFKAWISDSTVSAKQRMFRGRGRYVLINGLVVAASWDALLAGELKNPINVTEASETKNYGAWTGTLPDGSAAVGSDHCADWTSQFYKNTGYWGRSAMVTAEWTIADPPVDQPGDCAVARALYCFEQE